MGVIGGGVLVGLIVAIGAGLTLDRIRGVASRAEGQLEQALRQIPSDLDRARWREELATVLLLCDGRPLKQFRESRELIKAAEGVAAVYAPSPLAGSAGPARRGSSAGKAEGFEDGRLNGGDKAALPSRGLADLLTKETIRYGLQALSYRERRVLELRYGLGGEPPRGLDDIGHIFAITEERVREIEGLSLKKLQCVAEAQKLREVAPT